MLRCRIKTADDAPFDFDRYSANGDTSRPEGIYPGLEAALSSQGSPPTVGLASFYRHPTRLFELRSAKLRHPEHAALPHPPSPKRINDDINVVRATNESWRSSKNAFVHHLDWL